MKRGSSTGKHSEDKRKLDEKENNRPMKNKNLLSFFTKQKKEDTPKYSGQRGERSTESIEKAAERGEEETTEETLKNFGREEEVRTVEQTKKDYGSDDEDDGVLFPLRGPGFEWYLDKGVKLKANVARTEERMKNTVIMENNEMKGLTRGAATGSLSENVDVLMDKLSSAASSKQQDHMSAMISIAYFIMNNGLIIPTQVLAEKYKEVKGLKESTRIESARLLEVLTKHLNVVQIYIDGRGYILENRGLEIEKILDSLKNVQGNDQLTVNKKVEEAIGSNYETLMEYLDSKRDRDTLKAVLTKVTSVNLMTRLASVQDKRSFQRAKGLVGQNLELFKDMKNKLMADSGSLSDAQKKKKNRLLQSMKLEKLRHIFKGRGRRLKCEEFPDLAALLEFAFGEGDRVDRAGGGLESHPRLTDTVLYRAADNNTVMRQARETVLALAPEGFNISLSSCFNYTQNYREGTYQARRHHSGRGINACLSLHKPPRTGVEQFVINLHWSTQNVNLTLDLSHAYPDNILVDSKDAKAKIHADVSPVQKPGKTWRKIILPDHDWSRLAHNAITPMTHLFLKTETILEEEEENNILHNVRRTGTAATLLNLSYFEPETVQRVFNELFLLLNNPALDHLFRNPKTNKLKEHFVFVVDNGPSEAPASPLVRMWLVRLARLLQLKTVTQKSFAEYHSKRNPVERVHAVHNHTLSNEQFSSKEVHSEYEIGDTRHKENMEHMAEKVRQCLIQTQYGGNPCHALRGIGADENFIFDDEEELVTFLGKSEFRKNEDEGQYQPVKTKLWRDVATVWNLNENFVGSYRDDYQIVQNGYDEEGERTCWSDKYSTVIFNPDISRARQEKCFTMQPIPDYVRWLKTGGEMHYLPLEKLQQLHTEVVDNTPAAFLPSTILELTCKVFSYGVETILPCISFISWCTEEDVNVFFKDFKEKNDKSFINDKEREYWAQHELYQEKSKDELQALCRQKKLPAEGKKHDCVKRLVEKMECELPPPLNVYSGQLDSVPNSISEISKLSVYKLREILRFHNILDCSTKDELAIRVGMLKSGRAYLAFQKELEATVNLVTAVTSLIAAEKSLYLADPRILHKRRAFSTPTQSSLSTKRPRDTASIAGRRQSSFLTVPRGITLDNLQEVLEPLKVELGLYEERIRLANNNSGTTPRSEDGYEMDAMRLVGTRVLAYWSKNEVGNTGWTTGKKFSLEKS